MLFYSLYFYSIYNNNIIFVVRYFADKVDAMYVDVLLYG